MVFGFVLLHSELVPGDSLLGLVDHVGHLLDLEVDGGQLVAELGGLLLTTR